MAGSRRRDSRPTSNDEASEAGRVKVGSGETGSGKVRSVGTGKVVLWSFVLSPGGRFTAFDSRREKFGLVRLAWLWKGMLGCVMVRHFAATSTRAVVSAPANVFRTLTGRGGQTCSGPNCSK